MMNAKMITVKYFCSVVVRSVNGITFVGSVKEKTVARNLYAQAKARGKAAGIVRYYAQYTRAKSPTCPTQINFLSISD